MSSAAQILAFAQHEHMSLLSIWALQRDNGGCPGSVDSNTCSGIRHALLACENQWTRHATVILNPPSNEPVDPVAMFTPPTTCHGGQGD